MTIESKRMKAVIVSNESDPALDLETCLINLGYEVDHHHPSSIIPAATENRPDLALVNVLLADETGRFPGADILSPQRPMPVVYFGEASAKKRLSRYPGRPLFYLARPYTGLELRHITDSALYVAHLEESRRRTELNFEKEKTLLKAIIDSIPVMITRYEPDANILYLNDFFEKQVGWTTEEIRDIDLMEQVYPDPEYRREALAYMQQATAKWKVFQLRSKSGRVIDSEWSNIILDDGTQVGIGIDISERKQSEAILKESERKFRSITEQIAETVFLVDRQKMITYISPVVQEYFGFKIEEMLDRPITMLLAEDNDHQDLTHFLTKIEKGIPFYKLKLRMLRKDGTVFIGELTGRNYLKGGTDAGTIGIIRDITEDKKKEDELKARQVFLDRVIDQSPFATFITDAEGTLQRANPALKKFLNLTDEQLVGKYNVFQDPQLEQQGLIPQFRDVFEKGRTLNFTCDWEGQKIPELNLKGSNFVSIEATMFPIHTSEGELQNVVFNWIDITDRRRAEAEKEKLEEQLRHSQKMQAIGTLAGGIAHDFNNLLQAILGHTQIMLLDKDEQNHDYGNLTAIQNAGERAARLVNQLLLFSRKAGTAKKTISMNQEIKQIIKILEQTIPRTIDIEFRPGHAIWPIDADRVQIEQALLNLGINAAESMPSGGQLLIETDNMTFNDEYVENHAELKPGPYVRLSVSDTGYGIHDEILPHIFEPFFTTKEVGQGSGMGLASVYGIIKNHGGHILCHSRRGQGTTFRIYLPAIDRVPAREEKPDSPASIPDPNRDRPTILLVDDDEAIRDCSSTVLKRFGYHVELAASGEDALDIFREKHEQIDLVILDLGMPGMGGQGCLEAILNTKPTAKAIIASGSSMEEHINKALASGAVGFIGKPYSFDDLLEKVWGILDRPKDV